MLNIVSATHSKTKIHICVLEKIGESLVVSGRPIVSISHATSIPITHFDCARPSKSIAEVEHHHLLSAPMLLMKNLSPHETSF